MRLLDKIKMELQNRAKIAKTRVSRYLNRSDYERWSKNESFRESWDTRTVQMAGYILPDTTVLEFGAGRLIFKKNIPLSCKYTPSDIVDRGENTLVCDLNGILPVFENYDYVVFSGVLEYVIDMPRLIKHLTPSTDTFIVSYATKELVTNHREIHGWVNNFAKNDFIEMFENLGYSCEIKPSWKNQEIFVFSKL